MPTDSHIHFVPPDLLSKEVGTKDGPSISYKDGHQHAVFQKGNLVNSVVKDFANLDVIKGQSASIGIDRLVLSPWVAMIPLDEDAKVAAEICRRHNYAMAKYVDDQSEVRGLATIPMQDPGLAIEVLREALDLGLVGAEITPSCQGKFMGDPSLSEFWEEVQILGTAISVHPSTRGLDMAVFSQRYLWNSLANPLETALGASQMVLNGYLERLPELKILLAHGGGVSHSVFGRIDHSYEVRFEVSELLSHPPSWSFRKFHYDSVTHDDLVLQGLVSRVGASQVLLGTDHPFDMGSYEGQVEKIRSLFDSESAEMILDGNATRLFW